MNPKDNREQDYSQQQNHRQDPYTQKDYRNNSPRTPRPVSNMSIAALILGCLSILTSWCGIGGIIFGALGIIIAIMSRGQEPMLTNTKIGLGLSIAGLVFGLIFGLIILAGVYLYSSDYSGQTYQEYDYYEIQPYDGHEYPDNGYQYIPYPNDSNGLTEQYEKQDV